MPGAEKNNPVFEPTPDDIELLMELASQIPRFGISKRVAVKALQENEGKVTVALNALTTKYNHNLK